MGAAPEPAAPSPGTPRLQHPRGWEAPCGMPAPAPVLNLGDFVPIPGIAAPRGWERPPEGPPEVGGSPQLGIPVPVLGSPMSLCLSRVRPRASPAPKLSSALLHPQMVANGEGATQPSPPWHIPPIAETLLHPPGSPDTPMPCFIVIFPAPPCSLPAPPSRGKAPVHSGGPFPPQTCCCSLVLINYPRPNGSDARRGSDAP